jgi:hypothetical protein
MTRTRPARSRHRHRGRTQTVVAGRRTGGRHALRRLRRGFRRVRRDAGVFPLATVEGGDRHRRHAARFQAARVDAVAIGMRARHVERLDAAGGAEQVLGRARVELVARQCVFACEQPEACPRHDQVQITAAPADGAVAVEHLEMRGSAHLEAHAAAVAAAGVHDIAAGRRMAPDRRQQRADAGRHLGRIDHALLIEARAQQWQRDAGFVDEVGRHRAQRLAQRCVCVLRARRRVGHGHRLAVQGLEAHQPVERVLEGATDAVCVLGAGDQQHVGIGHGGA